MRALILAAVSALALSACSKNGAADNTTNIDQVLAAQNISANDTTAIDAATGDDANMAADVNFTVDESLNGAADNMDITANNAN
jgi:hypothetical protein